MKRVAAILLILLLGACVFQVHPVVDNTQAKNGPDAEECAAPESDTILSPTAKTHDASAPVPLVEMVAQLSPEEDYERGLEYISTGRFEAAVTHLVRVVEYDPNDARASYALGFAYLKLGEYEQAVLYFTRSQAGAQDVVMEVKALVGRGYALHILGRYSDAIRAYGVALQVAPNSTKALYNRGCSYGEMGEHAKAVADFERVLSLDAAYPGARNNLKYYSNK